MVKKWYVKYSDSKKAEQVSFHDYVIIHEMAKFYRAVISDVFHPNGKTLSVSFPKHFV